MNAEENIVWLQAGYDEVAYTMYGLRPDGMVGGNKTQWETAVRTLSTLLAKENKAFDHARFYKKCGMAYVCRGKQKA